MAGFGMILGGALKGAGAGMSEGIKARRAEQLEKLAQDRADARSERDMQFRSTEAAVARSAQVDENKRQEGVAAANAKPEYVTADDGTTMAVRGNKATQVTGADGKPVKFLPKASDTPSEVATAKWLIEQGVAKNANEAWNLVRHAREDPEKMAINLFTQTLKGLVADGVPMEEAKVQAQELTDEAMKIYGSKDAGAAPVASTDRTAPDKPTKVEKMKPGELRAPPGMGTPDEPYKASKQSDVDWFKKFAKPGQQIVGPNGDVYTK